MQQLPLFDQVAPAWVDAMLRGEVQPPQDRTSTVEELRHAQEKARELVGKGKLQISAHSARWELEGVPPEVIFRDAEHSEILCEGLSAVSGGACTCLCPDCKAAKQARMEHDDG